jgi:hypothetical protein
MTRYAAALGAVVVLAIVVARPAVAGAEPEPCALLTRSRIAAVLDQRAGKGSDELGPTFCQWRLRATPTRAPGQVNALVEHGRRAKADFAAVKRIVDAEPVDGPGRDARYVPSSGTLWVLGAGPTLFYVQANIYDLDRNRVTDGLLDQLLALATQAEAKL